MRGVTAESVNCFDGGTYEDFVREYSGEAAALLAMLNSEDPIKIESWIHHVFSVASGPLKAFAFLTMIKPDKTSRFGASELDKLVGLLRLNFYQYISGAVITHGMGRPALALPLILRYRPLVMLMSVMGSSCNISHPEVMNAFLRVLRYPLSRGKSPLTPNYHHPESLLLTDEFPVANPIKHMWEKLFR